MPVAHIIGAGIAGLAAAVQLAGTPYRVRIYEASGMAGGRCRSFYNTRLGTVIDNGNHLILGANRSVLDYIETIGAEDRFQRVEPPQFPFIEIPSGLPWTIWPEKLLSWKVLREEGRIPGTTLGDYLRLVRLRLAGEDATVEEAIDDGSLLFPRMVEPLCLAALNTAPHEASARLLWHVLHAIGRRKDGGKAWIARNSLSDGLIDPALEHINSRGGQVLFHHRLKECNFTHGRVSGLTFASGTRQPVEWDDIVILALPSWETETLFSALPFLESIFPDGYRPILNAHYRCPPVFHRLMGGMPFAGLTGGGAHWVFLRGDVLSLTVSAAGKWMETDARELLSLLWEEVCRAMRIDLPEPPGLIIKEKRATFAATPANLATRPRMATPYPNLLLAGDWTDTGLPACIDGAVFSGQQAAEAALSLQGKELKKKTKFKYLQKSLHKIAAATKL